MLRLPGRDEITYYCTYMTDKNKENVLTDTETGEFMEMVYSKVIYK